MYIVSLHCKSTVYVHVHVHVHVNAHTVFTRIVAVAKYY